VTDDVAIADIAASHAVDRRADETECTQDMVAQRMLDGPQL
jgi:hypothetical protein